MKIISIRQLSLIKYIGSVILTAILALLCSSLLLAQSAVLSGYGQQRNTEPIAEAKLLSASVGWLRTRNKILKTRDGGQTWTNITPISSAQQIHAVFFLNEFRGWAIMSDRGKENPSDLILKILLTDDGGRTWQIKPSPNLADNFFVQFGGAASLKFINERLGWMMLREASSSNFSRGRMFRTSDGGENWIELPEPPIFSTVQFVSSSDGFLTGGPSGGEIYATHDGGLNWTPLHLNTNSENGASFVYSPPEFLSGSDGILQVSIVEKDKAVVKFFETSDRGFNWKVRTTTPEERIIDTFKIAKFSLIDSETIAVASNQSNTVDILENDNVLTKIPIELSPDESISAIDFRTRSSGWILIVGGNCRDFKVNCSQWSRLQRVSEDGRLFDVSPDLGRPGEGSVVQPLSDLVVVSTNLGFDKCSAGSVSQMQTWWTSSPYYDANIYIGGVSRACSQGNLTSSWITQIFSQGWKVVPTWVGPQAPCTTFTNRFSTNATTARSQGISEANSATTAASQLGLSPQTIIYYDLEHYNTDATCSAAVAAFLGGWTQRMHELGNLAGVYGSPINAAGDWINASPVADAVWLAKWDDRQTVWGLTPLSDSLWNNNQRIHQYHGGHDETYGGVTFNIDNNIAGGPVVGPGSGSCSYSITPTSQAFASSGGSGTVGVTATSGCNWTATSNSSWITVTSGSSGSGNGTVGYSVSTNTGAARIGTITVAGQTFTVNQNAAATCPSPSSIGVGQTVAGSLQSGDCTYTNGAYYDAYTFNGTAGQLIYITLSSSVFDSYLYLYQGSYPGGTLAASDDDGGGGLNSRIPATSGFFSVPATGSYTILASSFSSGGIGSYSLFLGSGTCGYSITPSSQTFASSGGNGTVGVTATSGCNWTATSNSSWITVTSGSSGSGNGTVGYSVSTNTGAARVGTVTVAGQTYTVNQNAGASCNYSISSTAETVGPGNGTLTFLINTAAGCSWTAVSDATSWLTTSSSGAGSGQVTYNYALNNSTTSRIGHITVGGLVHTVTEIGLGASGSVQFLASGFQVNENGGSATVTVTRTGGTGTGTVSYATSNGTATAGTDYVATSGLLLFTGSVSSLTFNITIFDDTVSEGNETINLVLTSPSLSLNLGSPSSSVLTIVDNELAPIAQRRLDFDGDGKSDISIYRPSSGQWWLNRSAAGVVAHTFGNSTDSIAPADFTGDGKTDVAIWRGGTWYILRSEDSSFYSIPFGTNGDIPVPGDYDGDGKADAAVFRPSNSTWYIQRSSGGTTIESFGASGDRPVPADYDGDGKTDIAIYRPSEGQWWLKRSAAGVIVYTFGNSSDRNVQGDYTGDGKADVAIWRPSTGEWFILRSEDASFYSFPFGISTDVPVPGDYDGDGKFDAGVFRPSNGTWYLNRSTAGTLIQGFGLGSDIPVPNAFVR